MVVLALGLFIVGSQAAINPRPLSPEQTEAVVRMLNRATEHWQLRCDDPDFVRQRIRLDIVVDPEGRIVSGPTPFDPKDDDHWRAAAESASTALMKTAPFEVPADFPGGSFRAVFNAEAMCARMTSSDGA